MHYFYSIPDTDKEIPGIVSYSFLLLFLSTPNTRATRNLGRVLCLSGKLTNAVDWIVKLAHNSEQTHTKNTSNEHTQTGQNKHTQNNNKRRTYTNKTVTIQHKESKQIKQAGKLHPNKNTNTTQTNIHSTTKETFSACQPRR